MIVDVALVVVVIVVMVVVIEGGRRCGSQAPYACMNGGRGEFPRGATGR